MRLFTAISLPPAEKARVQSLCFGLPHIRWVKPEQIHLTMVFLGETNPALLAEIIEALEAIKFPSFTLTCAGIGSFRSRVLWLGVEPNDTLMRLEGGIRRELLKISGLQIERRKFVPHITLGRFERQRAPSLENYLNTHNLTRFDLAVNSFELYSSQLTPKGALHRIEHQCQSTEAATGNDQGALERELKR